MPESHARDLPDHETENDARVEELAEAVRKFEATRPGKQSFPALKRSMRERHPDEEPLVK